MVDDLYVRELQEAVRKAVLDLLAHEHVGLAGFTLPLNDRLSVKVGQTQRASDSDRFDSMDRYAVSAGPAFSGRGSRWIASFETNGYTHVFAGETVREAVDLAIADAAKPT
jgi:hypothetical protein